MNNCVFLNEKSGLKYIFVFIIFFSLLIPIFLYGQWNKQRPFSFDGLIFDTRNISYAIDECSINSKGVIYVKGWAIVKGISSQEHRKYIIQKDLSSGDSYILPMQTNSREDVSNAFLEKNTYNKSGFSVSGKILNRLKYKTFIILMTDSNHYASKEFSCENK